MNELRVGKAAQVGDVTLIPLFRIELSSIQQPDFLWLNGTAEPFAVVFIEPGGARAVGVNGGELDIERLVQQMPELEALISCFPDTSAST